MLETVVAIAVVVSIIIKAIFNGIAALRIADAWIIWAQRCDPKNPNFQPPSSGRKS